MSNKLLAKLTPIKPRIVDVAIVMRKNGGIYATNERKKEMAKKNIAEREKIHTKKNQWQRRTNKLKQHVIMAFE